MREAPHNLDAERSVLGSVLIDNEMLEVLADMPTEAFYAEKNRVIGREMLALQAAGEPIDLVTLTERLRVNGQLDKVGGLAYLLGLGDAAPVAYRANEYGRIVRENHRARELIALCGQTMQAAYDGQPVDEILERHEEGLTTFSRFDALERGPEDYAQGALDLIMGVGGLATGFPDLDHVSGGIVKGGFNVIAARPSLGKSALLRGILNNRTREGDTVCLFSIDQSGDDIYALEATHRASVSLEDFRPDKYGQRRAPPRKLEETREKLVWLRDEWSRRFIIHDSRAELASIINKARQEIRAGATIIAIDHIQAVLHAGKSDETSVVSSISRAFKALSREYNVTVILLSQLGRKVEDRNPPRPMLSDLRQSGAIEEDANQVLFIYRDDYYAELQSRDSRAPGIAEIIIAKNKLGRVPQTTELTWVGRYASFGSKDQVPGRML